VRAPWRGSARRRVAWFGLIAAVFVAHALLGLRVLASVIGWNTTPEPRRIEIAFSQQLQPAAAPGPAATALAPPAPAGPRRPRAIRAPRASSAPASAPDPGEAASASSRQALDDEALALADRLEKARQAAEAASAASAAQAIASAASASAAETGTAPASAAPASPAALPGPDRKPLDWPPSTRLTYTVTGLVRGGNLYGEAIVEWRRDGAHYQVQSDVHITNLFARRHIFSDGEITAQGLSPRHFEELFEPPLVAPRRNVMEFTDTEVVLPSGNRVIKFPRTQDEASQFVQFVWLFTMRPELAVPGTLIDFPVALSRSVRHYHYRVKGSEPLEMPFGTVPTIHLVPELEGPRRPGEYTFEFWMAPTLQYLPIRVLIKNDEQNLADLKLDALPLQAAPASAPDGAASQAMLR